MEGIGLDNMLGAEQVEKLFSDNATLEGTDVLEVNAGEETPVDDKNNETEETAEVDFSDLLGNNQPEGVGSGENTKRDGGAPESSSGQGTPQANLFSSIAKAIKDEGVFPDLSDDTANNVKDAASLRKMFEDEIAKLLDVRQKRIENAINSGASTDEVQQYQQALNVFNFCIPVWKP